MCRRDVNRIASSFLEYTQARQKLFFSPEYISPQILEQHTSNRISFFLPYLYPFRLSMSYPKTKEPSLAIKLDIECVLKRFLRDSYNANRPFSLSRKRYTEESRSLSDLPIGFSSQKLHYMPGNRKQNPPGTGIRKLARLRKKYALECPHMATRTVSDDMPSYTLSFASDRFILPRTPSSSQKLAQRLRDGDRANFSQDCRHTTQAIQSHSSTTEKRSDSSRSDLLAKNTFEFLVADGKQPLACGQKYRAHAWPILCEAEHSRSLVFWLEWATPRKKTNFRCVSGRERRYAPL